MSGYKPSPRVVRKRKDVDRQQVRRDRMKASGTPTTHVLDRALVEGLMYQIDLNRARGVDVKDMRISAQHVLAYATSILTAGTNGSDRYNSNAVVATIRKRIGQPAAGKFRMAHIPKGSADPKPFLPSSMPTRWRHNVTDWLCSGIPLLIASGLRRSLPSSITLSFTERLPLAR